MIHTPAKSIQDQAKTLAATRFIEIVLSIYDLEYKNTDKEMLIGLGTGSTVNPGLHLLGQYFQSGRIANIRAMPTSKQTSEITSSYKIPLIPLDAPVELRIGGDGADFIDSIVLQENKMAFAIKGGGRAQGDELIMAQKCQEWIMIADKSKKTTNADGSPRHFNQNDWVPVEVPESYRIALKKELLDNGASIIVDPFDLPNSSNPFIEEFVKRNPRKHADSGNPVIEAHFPIIDTKTETMLDLLKQKYQIKHGLFFGLANRLIIASINENNKPVIEEISLLRRQ
jgi:ribose 5-phosphate isomerase A